MSSHPSFIFSRMTFGDNPYIPPPNLSIGNGRITQVSSHPSNQMNFQSNFSEDNLSNVDTLIYYPIRGKTNDMQLPNKKAEQSLIEGLMPKNQRKKDILQPQPPNYVSFLQPANYDSVAGPTNLASVTQPTNYDQVSQPINHDQFPQPTNHAPFPQLTNYASVPQTTIYDSVPQLTNYASVPQTTIYDSVPQTTNYASNPQTTIYDSVPQTTNYASIPQTTIYDSVPQITNYDSIPQTTVYDSVPQTTNYTSITQPINYASTTLPNNYPRVTPPNNYRPVTPPNNYPSVTQPKDYATVTQITKHASIPQNSKTLIKDLMPSQEKNENVLIPPSDYQLALSNEQQQNIIEQHMPNNSQMIYKEGHISQPYNEANNYGKIPEHQVQESNYDPLFQIQGQPNDGNENAFILNEKGSNEEKGYSYNKLNNKIISTSNRLDEKILQQENLNEWFRKVVLELQNSNKEMGKEMNKTFNKIEETFNELGKLHKEQKFLNEKIFQWMRGRHTYSEYPIYHHSENPIYQYSESPINQYAENPIYI